MIVYSPPLRFIYRMADRVVLPGFEKQSLFDVGKFFFRELRNNKLNVRGAAVTYNFLMAIPPTLLFLFSLVPYLPLQNAQETIVGALQLVIPNRNVSQTLSRIVVDFMNTERRDLLSFGILLTLFFSSNGMMGLMRSFDRSLSVYKKRSGLQRRWTAIKLTVLLIIVAIFTIAALILQSSLLDPVLIRLFGSAEAVQVVSLLIIGMLIFVTISLIYTYGPSLTSKFPFVSPGSVFATLLVIATSTIFFFLVNNILNYNKVYGSIGTLIAFMVWLWLNTQIILVGYELNVSILLSRLSKTTTTTAEL